MTRPHRGVRILLAAGALALLSGCIAVVSGGHAHPRSPYHHHLYDDAPRRWHAPAWRWRHRHFHAPDHHSRWRHHRRR